MEGRWSILLTIGTALAAVLGALASHGAGALAALAGVPALLQAWAHGLPLGVWSFALASVLSVLVWVAAIRCLPVGASGKVPFGYANILAVLVAVALTVAQQYLAPNRSPGGLLNAFVLGLIAGLIAPHVGVALRGKARTS